MKSVKPILLLSFLFFASVIADDYSEPISTNNEVENFDSNEDYGLEDSDVEDYDSDENEDIIYTNMISKKTPSPPPPLKYPSSASLIKSPPTTPPPCRKWRCSMNGYVPKWKPDVSAACRDNYSKMGIMTKAVCQDQFCVKVCEKF